MPELGLWRFTLVLLFGLAGGVARGAVLNAWAQSSMAYADAATEHSAQVNAVFEGSASDSAELANGWRWRWRTELRVESGRRPCLVISCEQDPRVDGIVVGSISHYAWGMLTVGRNSGLASEIAVRSHPFGFESVGSDRCAALLQSSCPLRRPVSVTYLAPTFSAVTPSVQIATGSGSTSFGIKADVRLLGGNVLVALSGTGSGQWVAPLGLSLPISDWRIYATKSFGKTVNGRADYAALGLSKAALGGELRVAASRLNLNGSTASGTKYAAGFHRVLSLEWIAFADVAAVRYQGGQLPWRGVEVGVMWSYR